MHRTPCLLPLLCAVALSLVRPAQAGVIADSGDTLALGALVRERLDLDAAGPAELLAGAESQFAFFFPGGASNPVSDRAHIDALVAATVLLEEGLSRGAGGYRQARTLFDCYTLMYASGRAGRLQRTLAEMRAQAGEGEEARILGVYLDTVVEFEAHGLAAAQTLGTTLMRMRPRDTEVAYTLATIAEQQGRYEDAVQLYESGLEGARHWRHWMSLAELQETLAEGEGSAALSYAESLAGDLTEDAVALRERASRRRRLEALAARAERGRLDTEQHMELAILYRQTGRLQAALEAFDALSSDRSAPATVAEEHAIAAMEGNQPERMREVLAATRGQADPSPRLLQLRIVAESLQVVRSAAQDPDGALALSDFLALESGADLRADLVAFSAVDPVRARFATVYLELMSALVEYQRSDSLPESRVREVQAEVDALIAQDPERGDGYLFKVMLAIYSRDVGVVQDALNGYQAFCGRHECRAEARRLAATVWLQHVARTGDTGPLEYVQDILSDWPAQERPAFYHLAQATRGLLNATLSGSGRFDAVAEEITEELHAGLAAAWTGGRDGSATAGDLVALYNNLGVIALDSRDVVTARLAFESAREYRASHPVVLLNQAVALAASSNLPDAFALMGLAVESAAGDLAVSFQVMRWAGRLYDLADRAPESAEAFRQALAIYSLGGGWGEMIDEGVHSGGPIEWGLLYDDGDGLVVTLDLSTPPLLFVPAPIGLMEMSGAID